MPSSPWGNFPELVTIANNTEDNLGLHIGLHLTMLYGLLPDQVLPSSAAALLPQAWSISLEWQFYLIAPLFLSLLFRNAASRWVLAVLVVGIMYAGATMGTWFPGGFLGNHLHLFFLGVVGFALFRLVEGSSGIIVGNILIVSALGLRIAPVFANKWPLIPYAIWFYLVGVTLLSGGGENKLALASEWVLNLQFCQFLGKISYSVYLWHWQILLILQYFAIQSFDIATRSQMVLVLGVLSIPVTILVSTLSYRYIEVPGIRIGKAIVNSRKLELAENY